MLYYGLCKSCKGLHFGLIASVKLCSIVCVEVLYYGLCKICKVLWKKALQFLVKSGGFVNLCVSVSGEMNEVEENQTSLMMQC